MSSFPPYADPSQQPMDEPVRKRTSGLAITALVLSVLACCPVIGLIGPLLGVIALVMILVSSHLKGAVLAIAAIIVGLTIQGVVLVGGYRIAERVGKAPLEFAEAISSGDYAAARALGTADVAAASDEEFEAFRVEFARRYGTISGLVPVSNPNVQPQPGDTSIPLPVRFDTTNGGVIDATCSLQMIDPSSGAFIMPWKWPVAGLTITDAAQGDLIFPPATAAAPTPAAGEGADAGSPEAAAGEGADGAADPPAGEGG